MFRVKNFSSFKNDTILDLRAASFKNMKSHTISIDNESLLKTVAIYGKNASGKSNLISALYFFESFVYNSFYDRELKEDDARRSTKPILNNTRFLLSEIQNYDSEFEIIFMHNNMTYQYGINIHNIEKERTINEEWLYVNDDKIYERKGNTFDFSKKYLNDLTKIQEINDDRLFLSNLDYFKTNDYLKKIVEGIKEYLKLY